MGIEPTTFRATSERATIAPRSTRRAVRPGSGRWIRTTIRRAKTSRPTLRRSRIACYAFLAMDRRISLNSGGVCDASFFPRSRLLLVLPSSKERPTRAVAPVDFPHTRSGGASCPRNRAKWISSRGVRSVPDQRDTNSPFRRVSSRRAYQVAGA